MDNRSAMGSQPQHSPLGTITQSEAVNRTINAISGYSRGGRETAETKADKRWVKHERLRQLNQQAVKDGSWIEDITPLTDGMGLINQKTENTVYLSRNGKDVIKVNNLSFLNENDSQFEFVRDLDYFFVRMEGQNNLFPENSCQIIGFTKDAKGSVSVVMTQKYILTETHPSQQEISTELNASGFILTKLGRGLNEALLGYTNGIYEITDAKPENVLKDANGILHFIDLDICRVQK